MKKVAKGSLWKIAALAATLFVVLLAGVLSACGKGSSKNRAALTLEAGEGGSLEENVYQVEKGASLSDYLKDIAPKAEQGLTFAGWFNGSKKIAEGDTMPETGLTLTAKYYATYTVTLYLEKLEGGFETKTETGTAFYGEPFLYTPGEEHFSLDTQAENRLSVQNLGKAETFTAYLLREIVAVVYSADLPDGAGSAEHLLPASGKYGGSVTLADGKNFGAPARYRFLGWSEEAGGKVQYSAGESFSLVQNTLLHAVWEQGYTDRFGGSDIIFTPEGEQGVALLVRGGEEFRGTLTGNTFLFTLPNGGELAGVLYEDTFAYLREEMAGEYTDGNGSTLTVDRYWNAVYAKGTSETEGRLLYEKQFDDYLFAGEDGANLFHCRFPSEDTFEIGGKEAGNYLDLFMDGNGEVDTEGYQLFLDGYGGTQLTYPTGQSFAGSYTVEKTLQDEGAYILSAQLGETALRLCALAAEGDGTGVFLFSDGYAGTYTAADGGELVLDGFGFLEDSAVWTKGQDVLTGSYEIEHSLLIGDILTLLAGDESEYSFLLGDGVCTAFDGGGLALYELRRLQLGSNGQYLLSDPLLALYEDALGNGYRAVLYLLQDDGSYSSVAEGVYTEERIGYNLYLSTFERTKALVTSDAIPTSFTYLVGGVSFENVSAEVYYVLEWNGEKQYTVYEERNGEGVLWINKQLLPMGSLYFAPDGEAYQGTFSDNIIHEDFGNMRTFRFTYLDFETLEYTTIDCELFEENGVYTYACIANAPKIFFRTDEYGNTQIFASLALDGKGNAVYAENNGPTEQATYLESGVTAFGDTIYTLTGKNFTFDFIVGTYYDIYEDTLHDVYYRYDGEKAGSYESANKETLELDGYYRAAYGTFAGEELGTYFLAEDGVAIYFVNEEGMEHYFLLDDGAFTTLGAEYGEWDMVDDSYARLNYTASFDGLGGVTFTVGSHTYEGTYRRTGEYSGMPELLVEADLGNGKQIFTVSFMKIFLGDRYCVLLNEDALGAFIAEDWSVLVLDGYGYGVYYGADGSAGRRGIYTVFDGGKGHLRFQFSGDYTEEMMLVVNKEDKSFAVQSYAEAVYYADDLSGIRFGENGSINLGHETGFYFVEGNEATAYILADGNSYKAHTLFAPTPDGGEYGGKQYRLWNGEAFAIEGSIEFRGANGELLSDYPTLAATISFTPDGNVRFSVPVSLTAGGQSYTGFLFEVSYGTDGSVKTALTYDGTDYAVTLTRTGGALRFTSVGGETVTEFPDMENTTLSHGKLTVKAFGFGPICRTAPTIEGELAYAGGFNFTFSIPYEDVLTVGYSTDYGERYLLRFESEGKQYAMSYYLFGESYYLYCLATYSELSNGNFKVGALTYLYDSGNFTLLSKSKGGICDLVLFENGKAMEAYDLAKQANTIFRFTERTQDGREGRAFTIRYESAAFESVTVTEILQ